MGKLPEMTIIEQMPLLPLRGTLAYPEMALCFDVGRESSISALEQAVSGDSRIFLVAQRDAMCEDPAIDDMYSVGTIAHIHHIVRLPDNTMRVFCEGVRRAMLLKSGAPGAYQLAELTEVSADESLNELEINAYMNRVKSSCRQILIERGRAPEELFQAIDGCDSPASLVDLAAANALRRLTDKQQILECHDIGERLRALTVFLAREIEMLRIEAQIEEQTHANIEQHQREFYLREQMRAIRAELGDGEERAAEAMRNRLDALNLAGEAHDKAAREIDRYARIPRGSPETAISENYIEWLLSMPWNKSSRSDIDISRARKVLNDDHYGLEKVKQRILEYLSVRRLTGSMKGPILCLVGPPGVGKTSIAQSVARALKRDFTRISLGGVRDEAEIRGHRRTYIGAMPGRIISSIRQCGSMDPVFLLDEVDKINADFRGDPASALLEALDPEQNRAFTDHYLDVPFDLSKTFFITTANTADPIPAALLDRMEVIEVPSYTLEEKVQIAKRHLLKKQLAEHGLKRSDLKLGVKVLRAIIEGYTREAGLRALERKIAAICRKTAMEIAESGECSRPSRIIGLDSIAEYLGPPRYLAGTLKKSPEVGLVNGLAWTAAGGSVMPVEVSVMPGKGKVDLTGRLGDIMKESARIALSYVRSRSRALEIDSEFYISNDLHIHVPEGAVPKDGPSAGVAIVCAMVSALTGRPARQDIAMTGEVTLRGKVLPVGGVKEKLLAAYRMGVDTVLLAKDNEKDLEDIPPDVRAKLDIRLIDRIDQALDAAILLSGADRRLYAG